jgi:hypothetical protein
MHTPIISPTNHTLERQTEREREREMEICYITTLSVVKII